MCRGSVDAAPRVEIVLEETNVIMDCIVAQHRLGYDRGRWSTDRKYMLVLLTLTAWYVDGLCYVVEVWHFAHPTKC